MNYYLLTYNGSLKGDSGEMVNADYDLSNACEKCGAGALLIGNLPLRTPAKKEFYETFQGDLIISENIYNEMLRCKLHISFLKKIIHYKTKEFLPFYDFTSYVTLPKMNAMSTGFKTEDQCECCKREGYFDDVIIPKKIGESTSMMPRNYIFNIVDELLLKRSDIYNTWECYAHSWLYSAGDMKRHFARPRLIVSERVKEVFERMKIKHAVFEEVTMNNL